MRCSYKDRYVSRGATDGWTLSEMVLKNQRSVVGVDKRDNRESSSVVLLAVGSPRPMDRCEALHASFAILGACPANDIPSEWI
jgi:hypothetical protein